MSAITLLTDTEPPPLSEQLAWQFGDDETEPISKRALRLMQLEVNQKTDEAWQYLRSAIRLRTELEQYKSEAGRCGCSALLKTAHENVARLQKENDELRTGRRTAWVFLVAFVVVGFAAFVGARAG